MDKIRKEMVKVATSAMANFSKVDMFDVNVDDYIKLIKACKFYYKKDPIIAAVINRLSDMSATPVVIEKGNLRKGEIAALNSVVPLLTEFVRNAVRESLISGLVIPEVDFRKYDKNELRVLGIKNYSSLTLPDKIWLRNPYNIEIKAGVNASDARYYVKLPDEFIYFIQTGGKYRDGTEDKELYKRLVKDYEEIVKLVKKGEKKIPLNPKYGVIRKEMQPDSPYPMPFLSPVIEYAAYKRNLRRMDYSIASRVITAIMLVRLGNDEYPLTEDDSGAFDDIEQQLRLQASASSSSSISFERIIQLFADHTLQIDWIYPPVEALLNEKKYDPINQEILIGLGFPPAAIIGESLRSNTENDTAISKIPEIILSPIRNQLLLTIRKIIYDIINMNHFRGEPNAIRFEPFSMDSLRDLIELLQFLFNTGNLSRTTLLEKHGLDFNKEMRQRAEEDKKMEQLELTAFPPTPHSNEPPPVQKTEGDIVEE